MKCIVELGFQQFVGVIISEYISRFLVMVLTKFLIFSSLSTLHFHVRSTSKRPSFVRLILTTLIILSYTCLVTHPLNYIVVRCLPPHFLQIFNSLFDPNPKQLSLYPPLIFQSKQGNLPIARR